MSYLEDKLYSEAFNDGFNYAISKMFAEESDDSDLALAAGAGLAGGLGGGFAWSRKNDKKK